MSFNGSGVYSLPAGQPVVTGTTISSTTFNTLTSDLATALTNTICKDGQSTPTANIKMGGFKITNVAAGTAATDNASVTNVQNSTGQLLGTIAGTNTITAQATPTLTAYASGQTFRFAPAGTNTGATTLNIDSLGAKNIYFNGSALTGGEIPASGMVTVTYDGTQFNLTASAAAGSSPFSDATAIVKNAADATKLVKLSAASVTTGTTRTVTVPDKNGTMAMTSDLSGQLLGAANFTAQTVALTSISNATPAVFTVTSAQQLPEVGSPLQLTTSGSLPTGLSLATTYYVTNASGTTFNVCTTYADSLAGTNKVATSSAGSGTHTMNSVYPKTGLFGTPSFVVIEVWGAGGGGGGVSAAGAQIIGSGGGAGGYARRKVASSSLASTETVTIGAGGTAGANTGGNGGNGSTSSFGSWASATGGTGGTGATSSVAQAGGDGGLGASGDLNLQGNAGGGTRTDGGGGAAAVLSGRGGETTLGGVGKEVGGASTAGSNGRNNSGSGASGAMGNSSAQTGGIGGSGRVIVWEYS